MFNFNKVKDILKESYNSCNQDKSLKKKKSHLEIQRLSK